jgi:hypothetical protein
VYFEECTTDGEAAHLLLPRFRFVASRRIAGRDERVYVARFDAPPAASTIEANGPQPPCANQPADVFRADAEAMRDMGDLEQTLGSGDLLLGHAEDLQCIGGDNAHGAIRALIWSMSPRMVG